MASSLGLVLDLSHAGFTAATDGEGRPLAVRWRPPGGRHDDVADWVEGCLGEAGGGFSDLAWICVGVGPGSFTGIRIAMAFAQGLALPRQLPLHGFTSFAPLLLSCDGIPEVRRVAAVPANSGRFYAASSPEDPGALLDAGDLRARASNAVLILPAKVAGMESVPDFRIEAIEDRWNVPAVVRHARGSGRDATRPHYLQLSAAEAKAAGRSP